MYDKPQQLFECLSYTDRHNENFRKIRKLFQEFDNLLTDSDRLEIENRLSRAFTHSITAIPNRSHEEHMKHFQSYDSTKLSFDVLLSEYIKAFIADQKSIMYLCADIGLPEVPDGIYVSPPESGMAPKVDKAFLMAKYSIARIDTLNMLLGFFEKHTVEMGQSVYKPIVRKSSSSLINNYAMWAIASGDRWRIREVGNYLMRNSCYDDPTSTINWSIMHFLEIDAVSPGRYYTEDHAKFKADINRCFNDNVQRVK